MTAEDASRVVHETRADEDLHEAALHGLRWTSIARPIIEVALFGSAVVLARLVSPAEFGHFAVATVVQELAVLLPVEGVGSALVQRAVLTRAHLQAGLFLALTIALAFSLVTLLAASVVITPIFGARTAVLVRLTTPIFLIAALGTIPFAVLRRRLAFKAMSVIDAATSLSRVGVSVGLAIAGLNGVALVCGSLAASIVSTAAAWWCAPPPLPRFARQPLRDLVGYSLPASFAAVSWVGFRNCDYAIVGARIGAQAAGFYFRAYTLAIEYQKKVSLVMGTVGFPVLARATTPEEISALRHRMVRLLTIVLFPLLVILALTAPVMVPLVFGPSWQPAVVPTQILTLGGASTLVIDAVGATFMAHGRAGALLGFGTGHFVVYAAAVFVAAPFGLTAVAVAAAVIHTLFLPVAYVMMLRGTPERALLQMLRDVGPATVSCLGMAAAAVPVDLALGAAHTPAIPRLLAVGAAGTVAYLATLRTCFRDAWRGILAVAARFIPRSGPIFALTRKLTPAQLESQA